MKRRVAVLATVVAVALLVSGSHPAAAGQKCPLPLDECLKQMAASARSTGWIGLELDDLMPSGGYRVMDVIPGSPAAKAGIRIGDVLSAIDAIGMAGNDPGAFLRARAGWKPGQKVKFTILRGGVERHIVITLVPMPADVMAKWIGKHMLEHVPAEDDRASQ